MMKANNSGASIAVGYLARGADEEYVALLNRFVESYCQYRAGIDHTLYVMFKGFSNADALAAARQVFSGIRYEPVFLDDDSFDIGAYIEWSAGIKEDIMCPLNTTSAILCDDWLLKLYDNLTLPNVGLVGAGGSFESLYEPWKTFPPFPNIHMRLSGFMLRTDVFRRIARGIKIRTKLDTLHFESGPESITRQILRSGQQILVVGRNGRGYPPPLWPASETFRLGSQSNLLIADKQTYAFLNFPPHIKQMFAMNTWGPYIKVKKILPEKAIYTDGNPMRRDKLIRASVRIFLQKFFQRWHQRLQSAMRRLRNLGAHLAGALKRCVRKYSVRELLPLVFK
jgi:hypothetical protein